MAFRDSISPLVGLFKSFNRTKVGIRFVTGTSSGSLIGLLNSFHKARVSTRFSATTPLPIHRFIIQTLAAFSVTIHISWVSYTSLYDPYNIVCFIYRRLNSNISKTLPPSKSTHSSTSVHIMISMDEIRLRFNSITMGFSIMGNVNRS